MQTKISTTIVREKLKKILSKTISKLKPSATQPTVTKSVHTTPFIPNSQSAEADAGPPTLPFNPVWSSSLNISLPTGADPADTVSWQPYSLACDYSPNSLNHPAYSEMPAHRRKSEGQYFARCGLELTHDPEHLCRENSGLRWKRARADSTAFERLELIEALKEDIERLVKMNQLPFTTMVKRHLQLLRLCGEMCTDVAMNSAKIKWLNQKRKDLRKRNIGLEASKAVLVEEKKDLKKELAWYEQGMMEWEAFGRAERVRFMGKEEVVDLLMAEKEELRVRCRTLAWAGALESGVCRPAFWSVVKDRSASV